jgi:hypothetical protein
MHNRVLKEVARLVDWSSKFTLVGGLLTLLPFLVFVVAVGYCMWLHKRNVPEPEKQVALLIKASLPTVRRGSPSPDGERPPSASHDLPPAA